MKNNQNPFFKFRFDLKYLKVLAFSSILFSIISVYNFFRYSYFDFYILNKVFASVAFILLGIVILLGPSSRLFSFSDQYLQYRKELGIVSFFLALFHGVISLFFLPDKFPLNSFFGRINWAFIFALAATLVLTFIFLISNEKAIMILGRQKWWRIQYKGVRIAFLFVFLHVLFRKGKEWLAWYRFNFVEGNVSGSNLPEIGLLVWWFMVFVILIRIAEYISPNLGRIAFYTTSILIPIIYIVTFWWGLNFK